MVVTGAWEWFMGLRSAGRMANWYRGVVEQQHGLWHNRMVMVGNSYWHFRVDSWKDSECSYPKEITIWSDGNVILMESLYSIHMYWNATVNTGSCVVIFWKPKYLFKNKMEELAKKIHGNFLYFGQYRQFFFSWGKSHMKCICCVLGFLMWQYSLEQNTAS